MKVNGILMVIIGVLSLIIFYKIYKGVVIKGTTFKHIRNKHRVAQQGPSQNQTPVPTPAQAFCDPNASPAQICPGNIECPKCNSSNCPCPPIHQLSPIEPCKTKINKNYTNIYRKEELLTTCKSFKETKKGEKGKICWNQYANNNKGECVSRQWDNDTGNFIPCDAITKYQALPHETCTIDENIIPIDQDCPHKFDRCNPYTSIKQNCFDGSECPDDGCCRGV